MEHKIKLQQKESVNDQLNRWCNAPFMQRIKASKPEMFESMKVKFKDKIMKDRMKADLLAGMSGEELQRFYEQERIEIEGQ